MEEFQVNWVFESIGLLGSLLVALSMTMHHIKNLRIVNLFGCLAFGVYGILIGSFSVIVLNLFTLGANVYHLSKYRISQMHPGAFDILFKDPGSDEYIRRFVLFYAKDIKRFFPSFDPDSETGTLIGTECCFILRETMPVSLVAFRRENNGEISVVLDYAIPSYRDFKNGKFFFETAVSQIAGAGTVFAAVGEVPVHVSYLRKMGFRKIFDDEKGVHFRKEIKG